MKPSSKRKSSRKRAARTRRGAGLPSQSGYAISPQVTRVMVRMHPYDPKPVPVIVREIPAERPTLRGGSFAMDPEADSTAWAAKISEQWQSSLAAILECGNLLRRAKDCL